MHQNKDDPEFFVDLQDHIQEIRHSNLIIAGDWNLVLDPDKDYCNYRHVNNPKAREQVEDMIIDLELTDIYRDLNPDIRRYTWRRQTPLQQSRLDFFLISEFLINHVQDADIQYGYRSDHSMILLKLSFGKKVKRNSFWKFNNSLLKDQTFLNEINNEIKRHKISVPAN